MKRAGENNQSKNELLLKLGQNALDTLNSIPLYSKNWIYLLNLLAHGLLASDLKPYLSHGTDETLSKALRKASSLLSNPLIQRTTIQQHPQIKVREKLEAEEFLKSKTKETSGNRLTTKESINSLYLNYSGKFKDHIGKDCFTEVYHHLRIIRNKHSTYTIYDCPICTDQLPVVELLISRLQNSDNSQDDLADLSLIHEHLLKHKRNAKIQTKYFYSLWNDPPRDCIIIAEDAGKRFVLDGKGCAHVMMLRYWKNDGLYLLFIIEFVGLRL